jgi:hypothetical protein
VIRMGIQAAEYEWKAPSRQSPHHEASRRLDTTRRYSLPSEADREAARSGDRRRGSCGCSTKALASTDKRARTS